MCKLNIFCDELDGDCNCSSASNLGQESQHILNSILLSVVEYVKSQPDIWSALIEDAVASGSLNRDIDINQERSAGTPTETSSFEENEELFIDCLTAPIAKLVVGKRFSLAFEVSTRKYNKVRLVAPVNVVLALEDSSTNEIKEVLTEIQSFGTMFFTNITVKTHFKNAKLVVRTDRSDIFPFSQEVILKRKKKSQI